MRGNISIKHRWLVVALLSICCSCKGASTVPLIGFSALYGYMTQKQFEDMWLYGPEKRDIFFASIVALTLGRPLHISEKKISSQLTKKEKQDLQKLYRSVQKFI